jgi:hypothetical protein
LFVAATMRMSTGISFFPPRRRTMRDSRARRSFTWMSGDISATSSRKIVPPLAISKAPGFSFVEPVKAPFSWPNSSFSRISFGRAAQFRAKNGPFARSLFSWIARATSSFPVPDSPRMRTLAVVGATASISL